jgi:hypothetical protein
MIIGGRTVWQALAVGGLVILLSAAGCKTTPPEEGKPGPAAPTGPHAELLKLFPKGQDVTDWKPVGDVEVFGPVAKPEEKVKALESDAGADAALVRAYGYVKSGLARYGRGGTGEAMTLRIYEMESPSEAFGLFSVGSSGAQFPPMGLAARMSDKALGFVKGPYAVLAECQGAASAEPALKEFAQWVDDQITSKGYRPAILEGFPIGSIQGERYYLHTFNALARLLFVPKGDAAMVERALALGPGTDVAIMGYPTTQTGVVNHIFVIRYPTAADASAAYNGYSAYLDGSTNAAERNIAVAPPVQTYLAGTFNAEENSIRDRLAEVLTGLGG